MPYHIVVYCIILYYVVSYRSVLYCAINTTASETFGSPKINLPNTNSYMMSYHIVLFCILSYRNVWQSYSEPNYIMVNGIKYRTTLRCHHIVYRTILYLTVLRGIVYSKFVL